MGAPDWTSGDDEPYPAPRVAIGGVLSDDPLALPEVQEAGLAGFEPAPDAPLWCFLPVIWPCSARAWVRDRRIRQTVEFNGRDEAASPWAAADYFEVEQDHNHVLAECGLPPRPAGRLWLLRPPVIASSLDAVLDDLLQHARTSGLPAVATAELVDATKQRLDEMFANGG
ncbi:DUF5956 family protein [Nocardioides deserti]|uniref:Uncharacterized protein n=1 Tax=Nocardioides deserti TaxID=1588644 RepID=A0ABR6UAY4_9ACTN|nr:DUF5956 family protein [Nocardioides deserti]MBC2961535.1 hypothetical protein [Nocardioides deserti]GGO78238.1 hypothetical protein GCM10012276_35170 [Nocardioides deserti]